MKSILAITLIAALCLCFLCSCSENKSNDKELSNTDQNSDSETTVYQRISAEQAKTIMDEGKPCILLDVRTDEEFKEKRIEGAILIPDYEIADRAASDLPDKNALILIYCRSGRRSANVANEMIDMGYTNVYDFGGIIDWPYDTVSG